MEWQNGQVTVTTEHVHREDDAFRIAFIGFTDKYDGWLWLL